MNLGPHSSLSAPGGNMGLREPEGAAEEGAEARAPEASMAGEAWAGEDLKSRFGTPRGRGAPHPLAPAREHLGGEKRKGQRWVVAVRHPTGSLRQGGDSGDPQPSPTTGTRGPQPATTGAAERVVVMVCALGPWHGPAPWGHSTASGPRRVPRGHAEGSQQPLGAMGSASRPRGGPRHRVEGDGEHGEAVASISGCTASASRMWPWQASRGCGRSHSDDFSTTATASGPR